MAFEARNLSDGFGRRFSYVRLSVTEVCNFRCTYCLPDGWKKTGPLSFLTPSEIANLASAFAEVGVSKIRLTGGEPSVRVDLIDVIANLSAVDGITKIAMTTNGWNLDRRVRQWRNAGLSHLNVSVDSLDRDTFHRITGHDKLPAVMAGIDEALSLDFRSVKLNAVLLKNTGEAGFDAWAEFVRQRPIAVRFIELMRTGDNADYFAANYIKGSVVTGWLTQRGWRLQPKLPDGGPAAEYAHPDYAGRIGLIAPYAAGFCDGCNRLRVTSRGKLRLCLFGEGGCDLRDLLQNAEDKSALIHRISAALAGKPAGHRLHENLPGDLKHLAELGG
ncbi:GTP 3',8-cyclase MoaA [Asticcacaulis sp.]|uniref:GTP 3',8-cyclase MoaA n=1 Tax=Asticcacaulis sp. TaxID=1872648 RepID=UPI002C6C4904|nr:GTP 3',8-cyclase MoaA [Asticcacaulis sp.]HTM82855.1 GTP 3',8-cyclase MoaA [Asticcacaulis sp.]